MVAVQYSPNWVQLSGACNVRDLAGLTTTDDREIAPRTLLRGDNLSELTPDSARVLVDDYDLAEVIDLRTEMEIRETGQGPLSKRPGVHFHDHSLYPREHPGQTSAPWLDDDNLHAPIRQIPRAEALAAHYLHYLTGRSDSVLAALRVIASARGATLVNCAAGKDRTGTVIAIVLSAVRVDRATIAADYAASNERVREIIARLGTRVTGAGGVHGQDDMTIQGQSTPAEAMEGLLDLVDQQFGSVRGYLVRHGWTARDQEALEAKLLTA